MLYNREVWSYEESYRSGRNTVRRNKVVPEYIRVTKLVSSYHCHRYSLTTINPLCGRSTADRPTAFPFYFAHSESDFVKNPLKKMGTSGIRIPLKITILRANPRPLRHIQAFVEGDEIYLLEELRGCFVLKEVLIFNEWIPRQ